MNSIHRQTSISLFIMFCVLAMFPANDVYAFSRYSQSGDLTNCAGCHGGFRATNYTSLTDGQNWGNLHNLHRSTMLSGDCNVCHLANDEFPVLIDQSAGGTGMEAIACMGCHGRAEDNVPGNPSFPRGRGAGLRQHHTNAGVNDCIECHDDADPANYTPVGENILPPYYANPGTGHPNIPTGPCNDDGSEDFAGAPIGLDNDGDELYDGDDPNCSISAVPGQLALGSMLLQNHPNPFNPSTHIQYVLNGPGHVLLQVFSVNGELVRTLVNAQHDQASTYQVTWDGRDDNGQPMPSGIFFYRLETPVGAEMKKMVLLK
jgi:hypothetical protein